jgi:hypothetical protein
MEPVMDEGAKSEASFYQRSVPVVVMVLTFGVVGLVVFLQPSAGHWTPLLVLSWVIAATCWISRDIPVKGRIFRQTRLAATAAFLGWLCLIGCTYPWNLTGTAAGGVLQVLCPVTISPLLLGLLNPTDRDHWRSLFTGLRIKLIVISLIAAVHLVIFYSQTTFATQLYLAALAFVSSWTARRWKDDTSATVGAL